MKIVGLILFIFASMLFVACEDKSIPKQELSSEIIPDLKIIRIGRIAHTNPESLIIQYAPLMDHLATSIGVDRVDLKLYNSYDRILEELDKSTIDIGWLGTSFYVGLDQKSFTPFVRPVWKGRVTYQGQILTRADSDINKLSDTKGKKFAFVSKNSTSGFVFPKMMLEQQGVTLDSLQEYAFLKKHDAVVFSILSRQFQVGASYVGVLDLPAYNNRKHEFTILAKTEPISNEPLVILNKVDPIIRKKLLETLLSAGKLGLLNKVPGLDGFTTVKDEDYDSVRKLKKYVK
ncbi:MAG: phosphate/phosphite/phosphonate ABC transporter substrate-binding protein [Candidatus Cloacimonetes bacterium]|nr:phosphate/phosphite/phosphonate ABC transporter substrate-binding protein [Candidatus Cloacimonadota bacterium]